MEPFSVTYWCLVGATLVAMLAVVLVARKVHQRDGKRFVSPLRTRKGRYEVAIAIAASFTPFINIVVLVGAACWIFLVGMHIVAFPERKVL